MWISKVILGISKSAKCWTFVIKSFTCSIFEINCFRNSKTLLSKISWFASSSTTCRNSTADININCCDCFHHQPTTFQLQTTASNNENFKVVVAKWLDDFKSLLFDILSSSITNDLFALRYVVSWTLYFIAFHCDCFTSFVIRRCEKLCSPLTCKKQQKKNFAV